MNIGRTNIENEAARPAAGLMPAIDIRESTDYAAAVTSPAPAEMAPGAIPPSPVTVTPRAARSRGGSRFWLYRAINWVYFERITVVHPERVPAAGPVLYVGLHRNGAVDGFVYDQVLRQPVFLISTQLRKNWFSRCFFQGIAVTRTRDDGDRAQNAAALGQCLDQLRAGGALFVFPEGTSSLGRAHLPFKSGAAWLLLDYLTEGRNPSIQVVPVGIHYEWPWAFRSRVEVLVGQPVATELPAGASRSERLKILKRRLQTGLETVGVNVSTDAQQELIQRCAAIATRGTGRSYAKCLKALETGLPVNIQAAGRDLEPALQNKRLWFYQGEPLFPTDSFVLSAVVLALLIPGVGGAILLNLPPWLAGWCASRKFPDDRNVISLWKILIGLPVFALWLATVVAGLLVSGHCGWLAAYLVITAAGLRRYDACRRLTIALYNAVREPALWPRVRAFQQTVRDSLPDESN